MTMFLFSLEGCELFKETLDYFPAGTYKAALKVTVTYPVIIEFISAEGYRLWDKDEGIVKTYTKLGSTVPDVSYSIIETIVELQEVTR